VQLTEQENGIYAKRHPESASQDKTVSLDLIEQDPGIYANATQPELGRTNLFVCS
jgi:hypothetical protein